MTAVRHDDHEDALREAERRGFEPRDVPPRRVLYAALGLVLGIALSAAFIAGLLAMLAPPPAPVETTAIETARQVAPPPRLQISPRAEATRIEAAARQRLNGYAWTDKAAGRTHIPIDRAMRILAEQGWPDDPGGGSAKP